jgi:GNAT superfamily N-acetyltransferase
MASLRSDFDNETTFVHTVDVVQRPQSYRIVGVFVPRVRAAVAVAGFHLGHSLSWHSYLYIDDLVTSPSARQRGHASELLTWIVAEAARLGCDQIHLDSGTGPNRFDAHRLYHAHGFSISAHHFVITPPR